ncbi:MAG: carbon-monoxide dehydrogenase small subunit [bacterium]|nr:MAG: carbon-monoxide dehydrogenase small subunit [bacterium]
MSVKFSINNSDYELQVTPMKRLLDVLREDVGLTGTKEGCGEGECGACSVFINGVVVNSCLVPVCQTNGTKITTIEGLSNNELNRLQQAFIDYNAAQCGICIPGMLIAAQALLDINPSPSRGEIREAIAGNLCRCTGYMKIVDAIEAAALGNRG